MRHHGEDFVTHADARDLRPHLHDRPREIAAQDDRERHLHEALRTAVSYEPVDRVHARCGDSYDDLVVLCARSRYLGDLEHLRSTVLADQRGFHRATAHALACSRANASNVVPAWP